MKVHSNSIQLDDRILFYDGDSVIHSDEIVEFMLKRWQPLKGNIFVNTPNKDVKEYNKLSFVKKIDLKVECDNIPSIVWTTTPIDHIELKENIYKLLDDEITKNTNEFGYDHEHVKQLIKRVDYELNLYEERGLFDVLSLLVYIINTFQDNNIVWGPGRGSSTSSYVLYLIGVHDVDSVLYDLDIHDFLR
jgi:DNA polymerase III alpha subunit